MMCKILGFDPKAIDRDRAERERKRWLRHTPREEREERRLQIARQAERERQQRQAEREELVEWAHKRYG